MSYNYDCRKKASDTYTVSIKPTVEVISVHNSDMAKWTPIREDAKSLLLESVTHSSRCAVIIISHMFIFNESQFSYLILKSHGSR